MRLLAPQEAQLFERCFSVLQKYVNEHNEELKERPVQLFDSDNRHTARLIDECIRENKNLSTTEKELLNSWKRYLNSEFYLVMGTNNGSILVDALTVHHPTPDVFIVLGVSEPLEDIFDGIFLLPIRLQTVLLPFQNKLVYNGVSNIQTAESDLADTLISIVDLSIEKGFIMDQITIAIQRRKSQIDENSNRVNDGFFATVVTWYPDESIRGGLVKTHTSLVPCKPSDECMCGLSERTQYEQCCMNKETVNILFPSPPIDSTKVWRYSAMELQTIRFRVRDPGLLRERLTRLTVLRCTIDEYPHSECLWLYFGQYQINVRKLGTVFFGELKLQPDGILEVTTRSFANTKQVTDLLFDVASDLLVDPVKTVSQEIYTHNRRSNTVNLANKKPSRQTTSNEDLARFTGEIRALEFDNYTKDILTMSVESDEGMEKMTIEQDKDIIRAILTSWIFWFICGIFFLRVMTLIFRFSITSSD